MKIFLLLLLLTSLYAKDVVSTKLNEYHLSGNVQVYNNGTDDEDPDKDNHATSFGTVLNYNQKLIDNFGVELGYAGSNKIGGDERYEKTSLFNQDRPSPNLNVLSKVNVFYETDKLKAKVGAQLINTPLFNEDKSHIVPWSATGVTASYKFDNDLLISFAAISDIRSHTAAIYNDESASGRIESGLYIGSAVYKLDKHNVFRSYLYIADNLYNSFYTDYKSHIQTDSDLYFDLGLQYIKTFKGGEYNDRYQKNGGDDVDFIGTKALAGYKNIKLEVDYTHNSGQSGMNKGYGGLTTLFTRTLDISGGDNYQARTWQFRSTYKFDPNVLGTTELAFYLLDTKHNNPIGDDYVSYYTHIHQFFNKQASIYGRYEYTDYDDVGTRKHYFRVIAKYTF